jgi:aminoglycoside phosphotransferase
VLPHSYTNHVTRHDDVVTKAYQGPDAARSRACEAAVLQGLAGRLPVPAVLGGSNASIQLSFMPGVHGQDLISAGLADQVLRACGCMLRRIHSVALPWLAADSRKGAVLVHGDYGPNNVLLDPQGLMITAVLDWERAHVGARIEDVAWCEWIVRMHHPHNAGALNAFFDGYGYRPDWSARQQAMITQCQQLLDLCTRWQPGGDSARLWKQRLAITQSWPEGWS